MSTASTSPAAQPATATINIGILAHVDAGKTSLTERLLYDTGTIGRLGSVDAGTTRTDDDAIERRRGITIRSAVASFRLPHPVVGPPVASGPGSASGPSRTPEQPPGEVQVNLLDTPGHSDFVAEVERALAVLDGAILVISAVEGVQAHTRLLARILRELRLPTLLFVNKVDRTGARSDALVEDVRRKIAPRAVALNVVERLGTRQVATTPDRLVDVALQDTTRAAVGELLAEEDDTLLARLLDDELPSTPELLDALALQARRATAHPLVFGSALSGTGVRLLLDCVARFLPTTAETAHGPAESLQGRVFAIERGRAGEKQAYARIVSGQLRARDRVALERPGLPPDDRALGHPRQVTAFDVIGAPDAQVARPGTIVRIGGLPAIRVGDLFGHVDDHPDTPDAPGGPDAGPAAANRQGPTRFPRPSLETVVRPRHPGDARRLHAVLLGLADQDPLIRTRVGPEGETSVLLYGEVQREVLETRLAEEYGIETEFEPSRLIYLERPVGTAEAEFLLGAKDNDFGATLGLRVEPAAHGTGLAYDPRAVSGGVLHGFEHAVHEAVRRTLEQGVYGWEVTDCAVTLTRGAYSTGTTASDFRNLTPILIMRTLTEAGTQVFEPCHTFEVDVPADSLGVVTAELSAFGAEVLESSNRGSTWTLTGSIPARLVADVQHRLPRLTHGEGLWWSRPEGDRPVVGDEVPRRRRTLPDPLDRVEYLRYLSRRGQPW